jgi:pimeloyl-ACP methyl ester carboxylesterase
MPYVQSEGAKLYYEEAGTGVPIVFAHEFSGDLYSWELQMQYFSRRYRCIVFNARGYPPSEVPESLGRYSPRQAVDDVAVVMRHLGVRKAHIVGCSMGSRTTLDFGLAYPRMAMSLTMIGLGTGSNPRTLPEVERDAERRARQYEEDGLAEVLKGIRKAPNRVQLRHKNPRAFDEFGRRFMLHSPQGCANTLRRIQARRVSLFSMERALATLKVPSHIITGDEDPGALDAGLFMKRVSRAVRLSVVPATGHLVSLEEPDLFNRMTESFFALVEARKWRAQERA